MENDSSKTETLFPLQTCPQVSDEAFNLFHSIDRELYTLLIQNLGRDPAESVQVMAFWMWLERESGNMNLIKRMLSLPPILLNELADESRMCFKCLESDKFQFGDRNGGEITLLPEILNSPLVSLQFFHENRIGVLRGVAKIINSVCARAFSDILQRVWRGNGGDVSGVPVQFIGGTHDVGQSSREAERRVERGGGGGRGSGVVAPIMPIMYNPYLEVPFVPLHPAAAAGGLIRMPQPPPAHVLSRPPPAVANTIGLPPTQMMATGGFPAYDLAAQRHMLNSEFGEMLTSNLSINNREETAKSINGDEQEQEVAADDRTIFLTFSKGYPTSEDEVKEFFTRRYGDFIEDVIMQEVGEDEQVLYARMVAKSVAVIDDILGGNKAKFTISGKHVWARKYVKKQHQLPRSPPRENQSAAAAAASQPLTS